MDNFLVEMDKLFKDKIDYTTWEYYYNFFNIAIISRSIDINLLNMIANKLLSARVVTSGDIEKSYQVNLNNLNLMIGVLNECNVKGR